jgi:hypothetical protein
MQNAFPAAHFFLRPEGTKNVGREDIKRGPGEGKPELPRQRQGPRGSGPRRQTGYVGRATANDAGRSGYGSESVRPYLRAQLRLKELMAEAFKPSNPLERPQAGRRSRNSDRSSSD